MLNTKLTLVNHSGQDLSVYIGTGLIDPESIVPRILPNGESTSVEGYSPLEKRDVYAQVNFPDDTGIFTRDTVLIEAGNPKIGYPWVSIGGSEQGYSEDESNDVRVETEPLFVFHVLRREDLEAAKDFVVTIQKA
jgi:hypothetical protein